MTDYSQSSFLCADNYLPQAVGAFSEETTLLKISTAQVEYTIIFVHNT
jgi:hypothetical protein